jgi:hypothetical protein
MKIKPQAILCPVLMGVAAITLLLPAFSLLAPQWYCLFSGVLLLLLGVWLGGRNPYSLWYAPLLLNLVPGLLMLTFLYAEPPHKVLPGLGIMLLASYLGMFLGRRFTLAANEDASLRRISVKIGGGLSHYLLPLGIGFFAMLIHMLLFLILVFMLGYFTGLGPYPYFLLNLATYLLLAALFAHLREWWLSDALLLCLAPLLYWMVFMPLRLYSKGVPPDFFAQGMMLVMPATVLLAVWAAYQVHRRKSAP